MLKAAQAWSLWEGRVSKLQPDPPGETQQRFGDSRFALAFARIENHYFTNHGFFPRDGFLLEPHNIARIAHIPTVIVQGRYDVVCPPVSAHDLKKAHPGAHLQYVLAGHSGFEPAIIEALVAATESFKHR